MRSYSLLSKCSELKLIFRVKLVSTSAALARVHGCQARQGIVGTLTSDGKTNSKWLSTKQP